MLTYSFSDLGSDCLYIKLYNYIKNDILSGELPSGCKLPSKRTFAKNLGISTITVENAYSQLIAEGYIYSIPKKGYYVSDMDIPNVKNAASDGKSYESSEFKYTADLVSNSILHTLFPFSVWAKLMREAISQKSEELMTPPPVGGIYDLREAIAKHLKRFRAIEAKPEQIIVGAGTEYLYSLIIQLLGNDKIFAVEDPGYSKVMKIYKSFGVKCASLSLDSKGAVISETDCCDVIHISPSHHFPTGIVMPISRRYEILSWAAEDENRYIIEDDYDSEFRLNGRPIPSLKSIDVTDKVIYMNTFTKSLASTIRISYMVLPDALAERFYNKLGFYSCTVSNFEQYTLAEFINGGYFENHINRMRKYYKSVRDGILEAIKSNPRLKEAEIQEENAGLHFLLKLRTDMTDEEIKKKARRNGINLSCLSEYYTDKSKAPSSTIIINYSNIVPEKTGDIVEKLSKIIT